MSFGWQARHDFLNTSSPAFGRLCSSRPPSSRAIFSDLKLAWCGLRARPALALTALATFAVGTGATTTMYSVVHGVLLRPLPYHEPNRIVRLWEEHPGAPITFEQHWLSHVTLDAWQPRATSVAALARHAWAPTRSAVIIPRASSVLQVGDVGPATQAFLVNEEFVRQHWNDGRPLIGRRYPGLLRSKGTVVVTPRDSCSG